jgi:phosphoribosylformimino-5-aminoimidazole carboxamide ribotide isomerase
MLIIPAIDLKDGRCVRLTQGRRDEIKVYDGDPVETAKGFVAAGAELIHVVDLDGAFAGGESPNRSIGRRIAEQGIPVEFGGGIRTIEDVAELIERGVERVIVGTVAAESPEVLKEMVRKFGARVCVGIDARDGQVVVRGWEQRTRIMAIDLARAAAEAGVERIIYTDVSRDGMLAGPNIEQTCQVARASGLRVTASGGVSSLDDIRRLRHTGEPLIDSVILGKALYENRLTLEEALRIGSVA